MNVPKDKKTRTPVVEGILYPSDSDKLHDLIKGYSEGENRSSSPVIYSPHAGYKAVGQLMGKAYSAASDREIEEVVIISPVHREEMDKIILPSFSTFRTAAGDLPVNMKSLHLFKGDDKSIIRDDIPHLEEHAIEDQLPFISEIFPGASILPVLLGKTTISLVKKLTSALKRAYGERMDKVLFVITGNLSGYGMKEDILSTADRAIKLYEEGNWREICEEKRTGAIEACGAGPLASVLALYSKGLTMKVLGRSEPEGKESEKGKTVAYGAIAFEEV